jgi:hypothetical protein
VQPAFKRGWNRRAVLGLVSAVAAGALGGTAQSRQTTTGGCSAEPAVQLYFDWRAGEQVYPAPFTSVPPADWESFQHPSFLGPYLIPPGWQGTALWADTFTRAGEPLWLETPPAAAQLTVSRVSSPDGRSVFEYGTGAIQGVLLSTQETALVAKQGLLGEDPRLRPICLIDDPHNPLAPGWFSAERHRSNLVLSLGNVTQLPDFSLPATVVGYTIISTPRRTAEEAMLEVFFRILYQFLGGGSGDPTPTPTTEP